MPMYRQSTPQYDRQSSMVWKKLRHPHSWIALMKWQPCSLLCRNIAWRRSSQATAASPMMSRCCASEPSLRTHDRTECQEQDNAGNPTAFGQLRPQPTFRYANETYLGRRSWLLHTEFDPATIETLQRLTSANAISAKLVTEMD